MKYKFITINTGSEDFDSLISEKFYRCEVMESNGKAYGQVYMYDKSKDAVLCNGIVNKEHRRKGIGKLLHEKRIEIAKLWGAKRICIWVCPKSPKWVSDWYNKIGYVKLDNKTEEGDDWYELVLGGDK